MSRKANAQRPRQEHISEHSRYLSLGELVHARLRLSQEMVDLVLSDADALPEAMQASLQGIGKRLEEIMREARGGSSRTDPR
jgi:hypothetical protein